MQSTTISSFRAPHGVIRGDGLTGTIIAWSCMVSLIFTIKTIQDSPQRAQGYEMGLPGVIFSLERVGSKYPVVVRRSNRLPTQSTAKACHQMVAQYGCRCDLSNAEEIV